ncbi:hypothetical protein ACOSQ3_000413 [Xanthoceras sorbifolium]
MRTLLIMLTQWMTTVISFIKTIMMKHPHPSSSSSSRSIITTKFHPDSLQTRFFEIESSLRLFEFNIYWKVHEILRSADIPFCYRERIIQLGLEAARKKFLSHPWYSGIAYVVPFCPEPVVKQDASQGFLCSICMEELDADSWVIRTPCNHVYHTKCITKWLKISHCCPMCRFVLA